MHCRECGAEVGGEDRFCHACGAAIDATGGDVPVRRGVYAGFWRRGVAAAIDTLVMLILWLPVVGLAVVFGHNPIVAVALAVLLNELAKWLLSVSYFALFEASPLRATPGKYLLGIAVVDDNGDRITWAQGYGRELAKLVSMFLLMVGLFMAAITKRRQGLHDKLAGTRVIRRGVDDRVVMADPVAPAPHPVSVIAAFMFTVGIFLAWFGSQMIGGASMSQLMSNYGHVMAGDGQQTAPKGLVVAKARRQVYDMKIASAQVIEHVFDYVDAHQSWPASLDETGFRNSSADSTRVVYDADLKQVTVFEREPPLRGRSLQRRVTGKNDDSYDVVCTSPDIPPQLLPSGCSPR